MKTVPYAPEHNPDEFLNNDLKQAMARRRTPRDKAALKSGLTSYMRSLQRCPAKVRAFFQRRPSAMPRKTIMLRICRSD
jgi:hypothetical protein